MDRDKNGAAAPGAAPAAAPGAATSTTPAATPGAASALPKPAILMLVDGTFFEGVSGGAEGERFGEI
jgi:hypothetical protein